MVEVFGALNQIAVKFLLLVSVIELSKFLSHERYQIKRVLTSATDLLIFVLA